MNKDNTVCRHSGILICHNKEGKPVIVAKEILLEDIMLGETSQTHKDKYLMFYFIYESLKTFR